MYDTRTNRAKKNIIASLVSQIITLVCGIVVPKMMLGAFGSEVYGATTSIGQFLSYIVLLEGGIGGVARAALYKPLAEDDTKRISAIMREMKRLFRSIAGIFLVYALILACSFRSISGVESLDWTTTFFLVIVNSISSWAQYYIGISNSLLLQAAQKLYITNLVNIAATLTNTILIVVLVSRRCDIITVKLVSSIVFVMKPIVLWVYVCKHFGLTDALTTGETYLKQKWSGLGQHIAFFLHSNTDVVILTCFSNLKTVAVYSVYHMVVANIQNLGTSFVSGMEALFGDMLAKKEFETLHKTFGLYETIISMVSMALFSVTTVMIVPFVRIYTSGITDVNYEAPLFSVLLILSSVLYCVRMPYHAIVIAAGHFKQTQIAAYGEAAINVILSILLVKRFGLTGVAVGTLIATGFRMIYYVTYLSRSIFNRKTVLFIRRSLVNAVSYVAALFAGKCLISFVCIDDYGVWMVCGIIVTVISCIIVIAMNALFYRMDICTLLRRKSIIRK